MHAAGEHAKDMNISWSQTHFQNTLARVCLPWLSPVTNMKEEGSGTALSTLPVAQEGGGGVATVIACSAGA